MSGVLPLVVLLSLGGPGGAAQAPLACKGEKKGDQATAKLRRALEAGAFFQLAVQQLGAASSCEVSWDSAEGTKYGTVTYQFAKGSAEFVSGGTDLGSRTLRADGGFPDEAAVRAFLVNAESVKVFKIDWKAKPRVEVSGDQKTETYHSPEDQPGDASVDLVTRGGKLVEVALRFVL